MADVVERGRATSLLQRTASRWHRIWLAYRTTQEQHPHVTMAVLLVYSAVGTAWLLDHHVWPSPDIVAFGLFGFAVLSARPLSFLRDWLPFVLLVLGYVALAGIDPSVVTRAHVQFPIDADRFLVFGRLPTLSLQWRLWNPARPAWYDYLSTLIDPMHFIAPFVLAFVLWLRARPAFWRFVAAYLLVCYVGLAVYLLYPMAPPWWASNLHRIPAVASIQSDIHFGAAPVHVFSVTQYFGFNPVAAMPSIHAACSVLVGLAIWKVWPKWGWGAMLYPIAMSFAVIYTGQHYFVDVLAGWALSLGVFLLVWMAIPKRAASRSGSVLATSAG